MALKKRTYVPNKTPITAENLNAMQDSIIGLEKLTGIEGASVVLAVAEYLDGVKFEQVNESCATQIIDIPEGTISARIAEIHGKHYLTRDELGYFIMNPNYVSRILTDTGKVLYDSAALLKIFTSDDLGISSPEDKAEKYRNYIYFASGRAYYHRGCRWVDDYHNIDRELMEGEEKLEAIYDHGYIVGLANPEIIDITYMIENCKIDASGIIDVTGAKKLIVEMKTAGHGVAMTRYEFNTRFIDFEGRTLADELAGINQQVGANSWEIGYMQRQLGIKPSASDFLVIEGENEKVLVPYGAKRYAQISEIHGMDSEYNVYGEYYICVENHPVRLVTDKGDIVFELPSDVKSRLTDFGVRGNYIYFDNGKAFYHQANRIYKPYDTENGEYGYYNPPLEDGEEVIHQIKDLTVIIKLAAPVITDISDYITTDGIIDICDAEYITVVPLKTKEEVEAMVNVENGDYDDYRFDFPNVKIIVEAYGR